MKIILTLLSVLFFALPAYAQEFKIPGADTAVTISMSPSAPTPGSTVRLTLKSPFHDLENSPIEWRVNGKAVASGVGETTITVNAGNAGEGIDVSASVESDLGSAVAFTTVYPTSIELLWESSGYRPPFYKGRALASAGNSIRIVALPHFLIGKKEIPASQLIYTWKKSGEVLGSLSGKGRSSLVTGAPMLYGADTISVEARTSDGSLAGTASLRIVSDTPKVALYIDHPLFGILFHKALGASTYIPETEVSFVAIPHFAPASNENDRRLEYAWQVNSGTVRVDTDTPSHLTINAAGSTGVAVIDLSLGHVSDFFFGAEGSWQINFSQSQTGIGGNSDPFRAQ